MPLFDDSPTVQSVVWQMRLSDQSRAQNRALIQNLFNGGSPYTPEQVQDSLAATNVNDLSAVTLSHEARRNFANAFQKPGKFFTVSLDSGPIHKRQEWSTTITNEINRVMKRSRKYFEVLRSNFANVVLYGIGPSFWSDTERWIPEAAGVGDVLIPSGTWLTMDNLSLFAVYNKYTAAQLKRMTGGPRRDPAWNMPAVNKAIKWADSQTATLYGNGWTDVWAPERQEERIKEDSGALMGDSVPTIDCYDFRFWSDEGGKSGWRRRLILDPWGGWAGAGGVGQVPEPTPVVTNASRKNADSDFLYDSGNRTYGENLDNLIHFQFADLSAFAPFRYHSVRSLGFLLYSVCHINNRLWCKMLDHTFENLMQYFRINSDEDVARALKVNLVDKGFIDKSVQFVPQSDRWQIDKQNLSLAFEMCAEKMGKNANSLVEQTPGNVDHMKATVYTGEMQRANALVSAALEQAYTYQGFQYREIGRRFCIANSKDIEVKEFRSRCLEAGVPEKMLDVSRWNIEPERVMGGGNQQLEQQIAQTLMGWRPLLDPDAQRVVLRKSILATSGDPDLAEQLVPPQENRVTHTVSSTQRACAALFLGMHVDPTPGENRQQVVQTVLGEMALKIQQLSQAMPTPQDVAGLQNMAQYAGAQIQMLSQDPTAKPLAQQLGQDLAKMGQVIGQMGKAVQQAQEQAMAAGGQNGEAQAEHAKTAASIQGTIIQAKAKAENTRESHAQKTAQRQTQFEMETQRKAESFQQDMLERQQTHDQEMRERAQSHALDTSKQIVDDTLDVKRKVKEASKPKNKVNN